MRRLIILAGALTGFALAGCGGASSSPDSTVVSWARAVASGDGAKACTYMTVQAQKAETNSLFHSCPLVMSLAGKSMTEAELSKINHGVVTAKTTINGNMATIQGKTGSPITLTKSGGDWLISGGISS